MMGAGSSIGAGIRKKKVVGSGASVFSVKVKGIGSVDGVGTTYCSVVGAEDTPEMRKVQALKATSELNDAIAGPKSKSTNKIRGKEVTWSKFAGNAFFRFLFETRGHCLRYLVRRADSQLPQSE